MKKTLRFTCFCWLLLCVACSDTSVREKLDIESARVEPVSSKEISNSSIPSKALLYITLSKLKRMTRVSVA